MPDLYSEQDVLHKVVVPDLAALGYSETPKRHGVTLKFNFPIPANRGRERKTIFADLVVFVDDVPVIVVDAKNPRSYLTENDREQVVSYARLLDNIAPYAALCNGSWQVFDAVRKQQIRSLPTRRDLVRDLQQRRLTQTQRESLRAQATRTLFAIESVRELSRLMGRCHDIIRNLKGYDPTKAFDELSKLLFAKMYEEREVADGRRMQNRFSLEFVRDMRKQGVEIVQTIWRDTVGSDRFREVFADDAVAAEIELPPEAIDKIVTLLEDKSLGLTDLDVKGVAFEEFLSATYRGGGLGQYFTPREVVSFMVDLVEPGIGDHVIDPSCGSGGFLIRVYDVVSEKILTSDLSRREKETRLQELANRSLVGIDWESRAARTCKMNMIIHGDGHAGVYHANALDLEEVEEKVAERHRFYAGAPDIREGTFDIVLTNPPFGARDDSPRVVNSYELGRGPQKREVLLLERQIRLLHPGGRLAVVIPEGILSNKNDSTIRDFIFRECNVRAVIRLPQDAFRMSGGAACTSILYAIKKESTDAKQGDVFFARAEYIGTSPAGKPIPENDLLTIREAFRQFEREEWSGVEMMPVEGEDRVRFRRSERSASEPWLEPTVNRTSLLYDRLCYVVGGGLIRDRFSYTYFHPAYFRIMDRLRSMEVSLVTLASLCEPGYPARGRKPSEEALEGIPIIKVRNVTGRGIDMDTEHAPDQSATRAQAARAILRKGDLLITSTGEGTIGKVDVYLYEEDAIADGHIAICRFKAEVNRDYVVEFLRSELGQIQILRYVSGSTGQTELLIDHVRNLLIPLPDKSVQEAIVARLGAVRAHSMELTERANELRAEAGTAMAMAREEMLALLAGGGEK